MTQIDEPNLDEQLERIASIACGAELGLLDDEIVDEDIKRMNATTRANKDRLKKLIKALIANQVEQARGCVDCKKLRCENCERLWQT